MIAIRFASLRHSNFSRLFAPKARCDCRILAKIEISTNTMTQHEKPAHVPPDFLPASLRNEARIILLSKGERLFNQDDPVEELFFIESGELKAIRLQLNGTQAIMVRAHAGDFFAESAMAVPRYTCHAEAVCPSRLLAFPVEAFRDALAQDGRFALAFSLAMASHARRQCSRQERLRLKRARERILHLLTCEGDANGVLEWHSPLVEMAEELGLEPETLYRTLRELEQEGTIERNRSRIRLLRPG